MAKRMVYEWTGATRIPASVDAQQAGELLEKLRQTHGGVIQPPDVVKAAKPKSSPIHDAFEWDNSQAAEQYRHQQARALINSIRVVVRSGKVEKASPERAFLNVRHTSQGQGYVSLREGLTRPVYREQVLAEALAELKAWQARYARLKELADVFAVLDEALEELDMAA